MHFRMYMYLLPLDLNIASINRSMQWNAMQLCFIEFPSLWENGTAKKLLLAWAGEWWFTPELSDESLMSQERNGIYFLY